MKRLVAVLMGLYLACCAHAMQVEVQGNVVFATGPVEDDLARFQQAFEKPGVDTVALVNSQGGDLWTGLTIGRLIAARGLKTVTAGSCISACSIMFMGGRERFFSDVFRPAQTYVGIHGAHNKDTKAVNAQQQPQIFAFYKQNMAERFNADVMNQALYDMDDAGALLRVFDAPRLPKRVPYHCKSVQTLRKDCSEFKDQDALSLGVVTSNSFMPLNLPAAFRQVQAVLGVELTQVLVDPGAYFKEISDKQCGAEACRKLFAEFAGGKEHRAFAVSTSEPGWGISTNRDTPIQAFVGAIYLCNHPKDKPARLCETQVVNGYDVRYLYTGGLASHTEALAKLAAPAEKFYANEEFGGGMTSANGLRFQKMQDITPQKIDGIKTVGTRELALALKSLAAPVLIDVWAGVNDAIPTAVTLLRGGLAFEDSVADQAFEARFTGLLKLLSPDPAGPLVFYCQNRDCWLAVNAALRAKKLGYTQVGWYRGGIESWKAANLPLATLVLKAVAH